MSDQSLNDFLAERNEKLLTLDMDWARRIMPSASNDEVRLNAMHKARYECTSLPDEPRHESAEWLRERGYTRAGGAELLQEGELPK